MTVQEMRAAVIAIRAGAFDDVGDVDVDSRSITAMVSGDARRPDVGQSPWSGADVGCPVVLALAGHAGAGASTVAVALAEGLAEGRRVCLVDYGEPVRSGLVAASTVELGTDGAGWQRGRRGRVDVFRLVRRPALGELPPPPETDDPERLVVVDAGWSLTTALLDSPALLIRAAMVVVTRVTVPAVRQTEHVLSAVDGEVTVAAVGPARWPRAVQAGCGPRLGELRSRGRVVRVPVDRRLETAGLNGDPLSPSVAAAGRALAAVVVPAEAPQHRRHRRAAPHLPGSRGQGR